MAVGSADGEVALLAATLPEPVRPLIWPEYNYHANVLNQLWGRLYELFHEFQFVLYDHDAGEALAEGHTIPVALDGTTEGLGSGIDVSLRTGLELKAAGLTTVSIEREADRGS